MLEQFASSIEKLVDEFQFNKNGGDKSKDHAIQKQEDNNLPQPFKEKVLDKLDEPKEPKPKEPIAEAKSLQTMSIPLNKIAIVSNLSQPVLSNRGQER